MTYYIINTTVAEFIARKMSLEIMSSLNYMKQFKLCDWNGISTFAGNCTSRELLFKEDGESSTLELLKNDSFLVFGKVGHKFKWVKLSTLLRKK